MCWQLASTIWGQVVIGVKHVDHFHATTSDTLASLILAIARGSDVIIRAVKQANETQTKEAKK
mgnify:CR=1 FL=1